MMTRRKVVAGAAALTTVAVASGAAAIPLRTPGSSGPLALQYADRDAIGLAELVRTRQVSPTELLDAAIAQAEAMNPRFNFMAHKLYDFGRAAIARGLPKGPFTGVPWLLKDLNADIARELTEDGSVFYKGTRPAVTSELVERHMRAGLVIFGKTTSPEFGLTATTESTLYGDTRNPWDPAYITGGSSGGSAAAIASGVLPAAHATDGGGSIRIPASCCGLFGLKPSRGRVPIGPGRTQKLGAFSVHHAITRSVRDSAAILDATHGIEVGSPYGAPAPDGTFLENLRRQPGRLRIALMLDPVTHSAVDPQVIAATRSAARLCESLGHHVEEAAPKLDAAALGRASFTMSGSVLAAHVAAHAKATGRDPADLLEPITQAFAQYGKTFTGADVAWADTAVQEATYAVGAFMTKYDVILSPTLGAPPLKLGRINLNTTIGLQEWGQRVSEFSPFTQLANWTGQPAMSVPLAMADEGLPIGVMFTGRYGDEALLYRLAGQLEQAVPWAGRRPQL